jgi:polyhydroxyalkanoate synthesis regulator phasin
MADQLIEWQKRLGSRSHTSRELRTVEKLVPLDMSELDALKARVDDLARRMKAIEERPEPLIPNNSNEPVVIPKGVLDLVERVSLLESRQSGEVSQSDIDTLASIIGDICNAAITHAGVLSKRIDALEARVSNLPSDLLAEVGRAQAELRARRP